MSKLTDILKSKTVKIGSALLGAGAIVGIPLTYYLITTDNQPVVPPQIIEPPPIVVETDTVNPVIIPTVPVVETETVDPVIVVPEPVEPEPVEPEPVEPEVVSLQADSRSVNIGSVTGGLLNPLRSVYDVGEPGSEGVDVDRSSLRITEIINNPTKGIVEIVDDGKNLLYTPDFELTQGMEDHLVTHQVFSEPTGLFVEIGDGGDAVSYKVVSDSEGVVKEVKGVTYINLDSEHVGNNASELSSLLSDNFSGDVIRSIRSNFRFSDGIISNDDLHLVKYFVDNGFSEDSVETIVNLPRDLSPVRNVDDHSLRKLLAVEKSLYQNQAFIDSIHGVNTWPEDYSNIMKQASFVIPSFIEVIEGNKTINYDKLHLDEVFEKLGGEYTGFFSRGQNYVPFYGHLHPSDIPEHSREFIADLNNLDAVLTPEEIQGNADRNYILERDSWGFTENGLRYYDVFYNPLTKFNENVINFSIIAMLDEFNYTLGKPLINKSSDEVNNLFDLLYDANTYDTNLDRLINPLFADEATTGGYGIVYSWENGFMSNGERTNVYNQARHIIGLDVGSVSDGVFRLLDWLNDSHIHITSRPYFPNLIFAEKQEIEALNSLPNNTIYPGVYHFIPKEYGGIWFGSSKNYPGIVTGALRSLNVQSKQFNADGNYFGPGVRAPPYNLGSIVIDDKTWLYDGNIAFGNSRAKMRNVCQSLFPEENLTLEKLWEIEIGIQRNNQRIHTNFFYENTEACDEYNLPLTR